MHESNYYLSALSHNQFVSSANVAIVSKMRNKTIEK